MSLLEQIKSNLTDARKAKDTTTSNVLSTLYAEAGMVGKNAGNRESTDAEVIAKVKIFIKNIDETINSLPEGYSKMAEIQKEKELLQKYLPKQMSEKELKSVIAAIGAAHEKSMKSMGKIMGDLKAKYDGHYDGKLASEIVKSFLNG